MKRVRVLPYNHIYHISCILTWMDWGDGMSYLSPRVWSNHSQIINLFSLLNIVINLVIISIIYIQCYNLI